MFYKLSPISLFYFLFLKEVQSHIIIQHGVPCHTTPQRKSWRYFFALLVIYLENLDILVTMNGKRKLNIFFFFRLQC